MALHTAMHGVGLMQVSVKTVEEYEGREDRLEYFSITYGTLPTSESALVCLRLDTMRTCLLAGLHGSCSCHGVRTSLRLGFHCACPCHCMDLGAMLEQSE